jgi:hypothetical protein
MWNILYVRTVIGKCICTNSLSTYELTTAAATTAVTTTTTTTITITSTKIKQNNVGVWALLGPMHLGLIDRPFVPPILC